MSLLDEHGYDAKLPAGGQSLVPLMNLRLARPDVIVDLNRMEELDFVESGDGHVRIGAMTRHHTVATSPSRTVGQRARTRLRTTSAGTLVPGIERERASGVANGNETCYRFSRLVSRLQGHRSATEGLFSISGLLGRRSPFPELLA